MSENKSLKNEIEKEIYSIFRLENLIFELDPNENFEVYNKKIERLTEKFKNLFTKIFENKGNVDKISKDEFYKIFNINKYDYDIEQIIDAYENFIYANNRLNDIEDYLTLFLNNFKYEDYLMVKKQLDFYLNKLDLKKISDEEYLDKLNEFKVKYPTEPSTYEYIGYYLMRQKNIDYDMLYNLCLEASKNNIYSLYEVYYELIFHYQNTKETEKLNKIIYFERKSDNLENKIIKKINKIR